MKDISHANDINCYDGKVEKKMEQPPAPTILYMHCTGGTECTAGATQYVIS